MRSRGTYSAPRNKLRVHKCNRIKNNILKADRESEHTIGCPSNASPRWRIRSRGNISTRDASVAPTYPASALESATGRGKPNRGRVCRDMRSPVTSSSQTQTSGETLKPGIQVVLVWLRCGFAIWHVWRANGCCTPRTKTASVSSTHPTPPEFSRQYIGYGQPHAGVVQ